MKNTKIILCLCAIVLVTLLISQPLLAQGKKGPRASVLSKTECALDLDIGVADLTVTTTVTNKSSGGVIAEVRDGSEIQGTFKKQGYKGNMYFPLNAAPVAIDPQTVETSVQVTAIFDLCLEQANVAIARELNGKTTVHYGIEGGSGESRTVVNRCTDNPDTDLVDEGGIKVDDATFAAIADACGW